MTLVNLLCVSSSGTPKSDTMYTLGVLAYKPMILLNDEKGVRKIWSLSLTSRMSTRTANIPGERSKGGEIERGRD